jgi:hypothetical protein
MWLLWVRQEIIQNFSEETSWKMLAQMTEEEEEEEEGR